jgi:proteasome lid subunit RPN8/RPN11
MWDSWINLTKKFDTEWIAYLVGTKKNEREWEVTDMYFPKQTATAVHVEAEQGEIREGTVAAVHSHVGMGVFFSKEDTDHANHDVEVVINRDSKYKMSVRVKLECGRFARVEGELLLRGKEKDDDPLVGELKKVLTEDRWVTTTSSSHSSSGYRGGHGSDGDSTKSSGHYRHGHWYGDEYFDN